MKHLIKIIGFTFLIFSFIAISNSCKKEEKSTVETGSVTDIEGNVYKTVKIGNKWWMAENLKVKKYKNGDPINFVQNIIYTSNLDTTTWQNSTIGAYCIIDNNQWIYDTTLKIKVMQPSTNYNGKIYGLLYNWYSINDSRGVAPAGWHIPSDAEWKEMEISLGMSASDADNVNWRGTDQGNKLRIYTGWSMPYEKYVVWGTNESGFSALGSGCCLFNGQWGNPGVYSIGFWWTSSVNDSGLPWYRYLDYNKANVFRFYASKNSGYSIRCVKD